MMKKFKYFAYWRHAAAYTYLLICLMDFVLMPVYYEWSNSRLKTEQLIEYSIRFKDGPSQIEAMKTLREQRTWQPITLQSSGLVHISFGAILGVSAFTKKRREHDGEGDNQ